MQQQQFRTQVDIFQRRDVQIGAIVGLIVGLLVGWFALGWWLAPVQWVDARPSDLHPRWQEHYVAMVVDSYLLTGDRQTAEARLTGFDEGTLERVFGQVEAEFEQRGARRQVEGLRQLTEQLDISIAPTEVPATAGAPTQPAAGAASPAAQTPETTAAATVSTRARIIQVCGIVFLVFLAIGGGVAAFFWFRSRSLQFEGEVEKKATQQPDQRRPSSEPQIKSMTLGEQAILQYQGEGPDYEQTCQIYRGDEIIGSCGLRGVSTLSDSGHVVACAAWLYEQKFPERSADTRVLASRQVHQNRALRDSVTPDRDPSEVILAEPGQIVRLEHETLEMALQVTEVEYADLNEKFISRLVIEVEPMTKRREEPEEPEEPASDLAAPSDFA